MKHLVFWGLPTIYALVVMGLYFSGVHALIDWVTPRTTTLPWSDYGNRELGILENAQHLLLLITIFIIIRALFQATVWMQRLAMLVALSILLFMFLEEIDYGSHFWDFITAAAVFEGDVNYHNNSGKTALMKKIADGIMLIWFILLPVIANFRKSVWLRYLAPTRMFFFTLVSALVVSRLAHYLDDQGFAIRDSLSNNISEFRELFTYYIWFLYCLLMVRQPWPANSSEKPTASKS